MMQVQVHMHIPVTEQLLADIISTAVEGGINYWADVLSYNPSKAVARIKPEVAPADEDEDKVYDLNYRVISHGLHLILTNSADVGFDLRKGVLHEVLNPDESGVFIDAEVADLIVQLALFGEVVYG